ncbi:hypothetical protein [Demequina lutea]|uniref:Uncharacterized protein n=1 Tax=Demequina lutea TaxID=431489 RepID=A0A7Y9ZC35_9MICO|nr:hypothetical protein [Demequina lutea]NYI41245.1 hypothetical protein [Demequina lutea]
MTRRIPIVETLDLVLNLAPDTLEALRLEAADRDELFQHVYNLAFVVVRQLKPDADIDRLGAIHDAQHAHTFREHAPGN